MFGYKTRRVLKEENHALKQEVEALLVAGRREIDRKNEYKAKVIELNDLIAGIRNGTAE